MFELLGVASIGKGNRVPELLETDLTAASWLSEDSFERNEIAEHAIKAIYLRRHSQCMAYHKKGRVHSFVIGEVFRRQSVIGGQAGNSWPLSACEILGLYESDGENFVSGTKGNFTILFLNPEEGHATIFNSRFLISPFYYSVAYDRLYFSTSLRSLIRCLPHKPNLDGAGVTELALFAYPLGSRTYFEGVNKVCPGTIISISEGRETKRVWWHADELYTRSILPEEEAIEEGLPLFRATVNGLIRNLPRVNIALTAGFDSRAIHAVLERPVDSYRGYSFGIASSLNIRIPRAMSYKLGLPYEAVVLDGEYESSFEEFGMRAIILSDCLSTVERANYPYVFERLSEYSPFIITGLFGSELIRTFQNIGVIASEALVRVNRAEDPVKEMAELLARERGKGYISGELIAAAEEKVVEDVMRVLRGPFEQLNEDRRFYMMLLTEGLRGYFGAELQMERPYVVNRLPYLDEEFVEFLFRCPFAGVYSRALKPTVKGRLRSQYFYARVIQRYKPSLLGTVTDHGYGPGAVIRSFPLVRIGPRYVLSRVRRRIMDYREFLTEEWTSTLYRNRLFAKPVERNVFSEKLEEDFRSGNWIGRRLEFSRAASLKLWLEAVAE
jgi:hypothetical protein